MVLSVQDSPFSIRCYSTVAKNHDFKMKMKAGKTNE